MLSCFTISLSKSGLMEFIVYKITYRSNIDLSRQVSHIQYRNQLKVYRSLQFRLTQNYRRFQTVQHNGHQTRSRHLIMPILQPFLGPMPGTLKVPSTNVFFYPDVLTSHLQKAFSGNRLVKHHMRNIDEAARAEYEARIIVQERHVNDNLLRSMAIRDIPDVFVTAGKSDPASTHALFPLDIISAMRKLLVINHIGHQHLSRSFSAIEEFLVDQMINKCALSQGSGDWCSFVSLRRNDWDVNEPVDWAALCDQANKGIGPDQQHQISISASVEAGADKESDARFARIVQSLLMEFGNVAFAAFFRLQDQKYHYYCVTLPIQHYRLESKVIVM